MGTGGDSRCQYLHSGASSHVAQDPGREVRLTMGRILRLRQNPETVVLVVYVGFYLNEK